MRPNTATTGRAHRRGGLALFGVALALGLFCAAETTLRWFGVGAAREFYEFDSPQGRVLARDENWRTFASDAKLSLDRIAAPIAKPPQVVRVVVVGESTAAGFPFYPQLSFARLLEASLNEARPDLALEVVNFGRAADPSDAVVEAAIEALAAAPDVLVVCSGHNEFQASYVDDLRDGFWPQLCRRLRRLRLVSAGTQRELSTRAPGPKLPPDRLVGTTAYLSPSEFARGAERFAENLTAIVAAARARAVPVLLMTQVQNLATYPPCYSCYSRELATDARAEYEEKLAALGKALDSGAAIESMPPLIDRLSALDPGVAELQFLIGRWREKSGDAAGARAAFVRALELDGYPNRAGPRLNEVIRAVAARTGARLVDAEEWFAAHTNGVVPGDDFFLDYCHLTLEGSCVLADALTPAIFEALRARGRVAADAAAPKSLLERAPIEEWLARLRLARPALAAGMVNAGRAALQSFVLAPHSQAALLLARHAFEPALRIAPDWPDALQGELIVEIADAHRDAALAIGEKLARLAPELLVQVEAAVQSSPPLHEALQKLRMEFRDHRLVESR